MKTGLNVIINSDCLLLYHFKNRLIRVGPMLLHVQRSQLELRVLAVWSGGDSEQTPNTPEGLDSPSGLGTPQDPPRTSWETSGQKDVWGSVLSLLLTRPGLMLPVNYSDTFFTRWRRWRIILLFVFTKSWLFDTAVSDRQLPNFLWHV